MSYDWNNGSGYNSNNTNQSSSSQSSSTEAYGSLEQSYPKPFEGSNINNYRQRDNWGFSSAYNESSQPLNMNSDFRGGSANFKVIDDSQFKRSDIPTYHTLPGRETHIMPFSHAMKKTVNSDSGFDKYNNIFGETRLYNSEEYKINKKASSEQSKVQGLQKHQPQGAPRMKFFGDEMDTENLEMDTVSVDSERRKVYNSIIEYFPGFRLIKSGNQNGYAIYKGIVKCLLCTGVRYIVSIVKNDNYPLGTIQPLSVLKWECFQTRFAEDDRDFRQFSYDSFNYEKPQDTLMDDRIKVTTKNKMSYVYTCDNLPLQVEILKNREYEDLSEYGTVSGALELFQTILTFTR